MRSDSLINEVVIGETTPGLGDSGAREELECVCVDVDQRDAWERPLDEGPGIEETLDNHDNNFWLVNSSVGSGQLVDDAGELLFMGPEASVSYGLEFDAEPSTLEGCATDRLIVILAGINRAPRLDWTSVDWYTTPLELVWDPNGADRWVVGDANENSWLAG